MKNVTLVLVALALLSGRVNAGIVLYDSLSAGNNYGIFGGLTSGTYADSFSTGTALVNLTDIKVHLQYFGNPQIGPGVTTAYLFSDNSTRPGTTLATIASIPDSSLNSPTITFSMAAPYSLAANTRYWVELTERGTTGGSGAGWVVDVFPTGPGVAGEYTDVFGSVGPTSSFGSFLLQVNATEHAPASAVPEPATLTMLGVGVVGLAGYGWRRRKQPVTA